MSFGVELLAGALMGFFGSVPVAGPVALVVVTRGLTEDFRGGLHVTFGAAAAEGVLAGVVFGGLGVAIEAIDGLQSTLDLVGVLVLLLIGGWFSIRGVGPEGRAHAGQGSAGRGGARDLLLGFGMVLGNPGMIGTWGGAVAALEGSGMVHASVPAAPLFGLGVSCGVIAWFWLVLLALRRWRSILEGRLIDVFVRCVGVGLLALGCVAAFALVGGGGG